MVRVPDHVHKPELGSHDVELGVLMTSRPVPHVEVG